MNYGIDMVRSLVNRDISQEDLRTMLSSFKDPERFDQVISMLQERVSWDDPIVLPYTEHLFIVRKDDGSRVVKCECGTEFGDYRRNWKVEALVFVRNTRERLAEVYGNDLAADPEWMELREFYCPGCYKQLEVEAVPPGYPLVFEFKPDLDTFYREWLGRTP